MGDREPRLGDAQRKNSKVAVLLAGLVSVMVALSFAAVPLYDLFCRATGYGGTPRQSDVAPREILDRKITIRFDSSTNGDLPWVFEPVQRAMELEVGESGLAFYRARNMADRSVRGIATFNVTPLKAGPYFVKIDCFCFTEQILGPGEEVEMPVTFYVDPSIAQAENLQDVTAITLSYTFFEEGDG